MAMILRLIAGTSLAVLLLAGGTSAGGELKSSLPVGSGLRGAFYPKFVAGPGTGGRYCPVWTPGTDLVALLFVREPSDPLTRLVKQIDQRVEQAAGRRPGGRRLGTYVIFCSAAAGLDERLRQLAAAEQLKQLSLCIEPPTGPTRYEIAPEAAVTVLIFNSKRRVLANFALRKGELDEKSSSAILQALSLALP